MSELLVRSFSMGLTVRDVAGSGERLTVYGRVVPYGEVIEHDDHVPGGPIYRERFVYGALRTVPTYLHRIKLGFQHYSGYVSNVGRAIEFEERSDGGYMTFKLYRQDAEKAVDHLESTHRGLSLEFYDVGLGARGADGVVERRLVRVARVAALEDPAYVGAKVLAIRNAPEAPAAPPEGQDPGEPAKEPLEPAEPAVPPNLAAALAIRAAIVRDRPAGVAP